MTIEETSENKIHWSGVEEATEFLREERFKEALVRLREVIQQDPTNPYAYYFLGVALYEVGELEPARDAYCACIRLAPNYLGARIALCHVLRMLGDLRGAIHAGMHALSQSPEDADALYALGVAHFARGDHPSAQKYLTAFLETNPEFELGVEVRAILQSLAPEP